MACSNGSVCLTRTRSCRRLITGEMIRSRFPAITKPEDMRFSRGIAYYMANQEDSYVCRAGECDSS